MKIFTAMYTMRRGGAYDRFRMMLEAFLERGCEVHCLSITPILLDYAGYQNHVVRIPIRMQKPFVDRMAVFFLFPLYALWIGRREKVDFFIAFGTLYAFVESLAKWVLRKPMVTFLRGNFAFGMETQGRSGLLIGLSRWIEEIGIYFSDTVLSVNPTIQEEMRKVIKGKKGTRWEILPNNIPIMPIPEVQDMLQIRKKYRISEGTRVLVTAGVMKPGKNIETLIGCLSKIELTNFSLLVVGDSSIQADIEYLTFLRGLVVNLGLDDRVVFTGWVEKEELWRIFRVADLFVLPSKSEGMPNVMLEALGCNLPCLGSDIPGIKDILYYDELLFDPFDEMLLAKKIQKLFRHDRTFDRVKKMCQERKAGFTLDWKKSLYQSVTISCSRQMNI